MALVKIDDTHMALDLDKISFVAVNGPNIEIIIESISKQIFIGSFERAYKIFHQIMEMMKNKPNESATDQFIDQCARYVRGILQGDTNEQIRFNLGVNQTDIKKYRLTIISDTNIWDTLKGMGLDMDAWLEMI